MSKNNEFIHKEYEVLKEITIYKDMITEKKWRDILSCLDIKYNTNKDKTELTLFVGVIELS